MPADDLTPGQVAELLHVDSSTLRRWARSWRPHLSEQGQAKRRRYTQADLATFARGQAMLRAGRSPVEVAALLGTVEPMPANVPAVAVVSVPALAVELHATQEALRAALSQLSSLQATQAAQQEVIDQLRAAIDPDKNDQSGEMEILRAAYDDQAARVAKVVEQLRAEHATDRARMISERAKVEKLEKTLAAWQALPWWRRVFGRSRQG